MMVEEIDRGLVKKIKKRIDDVIKKNKDEFKSAEDLNQAKKIASQLVKASDPSEMINQVADIANLVKDSKKLSKEFENILDMI